MGFRGSFNLKRIFRFLLLSLHSNRIVTSPMFMDFFWLDIKVKKFGRLVMNGWIIHPVLRRYAHIFIRGTTCD